MVPFTYGCLTICKFHEFWSKILLQLILVSLLTTIFSCTQSFKEMIAMCLVKDQTKRPTAEKLLKHSFFKHAKPPEISLKSILSDLPPLWDRVKTLQVSPQCYLFLILLLLLPLLDDVRLSKHETFPA